MSFALKIRQFPRSSRNMKIKRVSRTARSFLALMWSSCVWLWSKKWHCKKMELSSSALFSKPYLVSWTKDQVFPVASITVLSCGRQKVELINKKLSEKRTVQQYKDSVMILPVFCLSVIAVTSVRLFCACKTVHLQDRISDIYWKATLAVKNLNG